MVLEEWGRREIESREGARSEKTLECVREKEVHVDAEGEGRDR